MYTNKLYLRAVTNLTENTSKNKNNCFKTRQVMDVK